MNRFCLLVCSVVFFPGFAFANEAADIPVWKDVLFTLEAALATLAIAAIGWAAAKARVWLHENAELAKDDRIKSTTYEASSRFVDRVGVAVKFAYETRGKVIKAAKSPDSPGGMSLTQEEVIEIDGAFWDALKSYYSEEAWDDLKYVLGFGTESSFLAYADHLREAKVHDLKMNLAMTEAVAKSGNP